MFWGAKYVRKWRKYWGIITASTLCLANVIFNDVDYR